MQNTTNLNLKKPEYTDFADIQDINDNMDTLDDAIHDTQNSVATFTSSDVADGSATSWTTVPKVASGETHKSIFAKMSQMFKNIRYLYKMLGTTDISAIGNGTVTGGLSSLNDSLPRIERASAPTEGTEFTYHTLTTPMRRYLQREIVGCCTGGSHGSAIILNIIPESSTRIRVTWSQALPAGYSVGVTFIFY